MSNPPHWTNPNDPNDPHAQPTAAGQYPTFPHPGQPSQYPQFNQQAPPPPPYSQPGQFGAPQPPHQPPRTKWYHHPAGIVVLLILFFPIGLYLMWRYARWPSKAKWIVTGIFAIYTLFCMAIVGAAGNTKTPQPQQSQSPTAVTPTPMATPSPKPTPKPTPTPTPTPTPIPPTQAPVQQPAPPPPPTGIGGNPYGYDLNPPGNVIYSPQSDICNYISCIPSFWNGHGYVEECQDDMFSKSGGIQGSCSHHGGDKQPLYSH